MKALLMHRDQDFNLQQGLPWNEEALTQDLELNTLLHVMAGADVFLRDVARKALLSGLPSDIETILYRQQVLKDCLKNQAGVRELYDLTVEATEKEGKQWWGISSHYPSSMLYSSIESLYKPSCCWPCSGGS